MGTTRQMQHSNTFEASTNITFLWADSSQIFLFWEAYWTSFFIPLWLHQTAFHNQWEKQFVPSTVGWKNPLPFSVWPVLHKACPTCKVPQAVTSVFINSLVFIGGRTCSRCNMPQVWQVSQGVRWYSCWYTMDKTYETLSHEDICTVICFKYVSHASLQNDTV